MSLPVILLDSIFLNSDKKYPQILFEECNYVIKNKTIVDTIHKDLELSQSDDGTDNESNE